MSLGSCVMMDEDNEQEWIKVMCSILVNLRVQISLTDSSLYTPDVYSASHIRKPQSIHIPINFTQHDIRELTSQPRPSILFTDNDWPS